jgi:hypothetical protein
MKINKEKKFKLNWKKSTTFKKIQNPKKIKWINNKIPHKNKRQPLK